MYWGLLLRLAVAIVFFVVARVALEPAHLSAMLRDVAKRLGQTEDALDHLVTYRLAAQRVFYVCGALFLVFSGTFCYHHVRRLGLVKDGVFGEKPYSSRRTLSPWAGQAMPYGRSGGASVPSQQGQMAAPYGRMPAPGQQMPSHSRVDPSSTDRPYGR